MNLWYAISDTLEYPEDIKAWIASNGDIPDKACVAMHTGWGQYVDSKKFRNADAESKQHYAWLPTDRWGIECLANLDKLPSKGRH